MKIYHEFDMIAEQTVELSLEVAIFSSETRAHIHIDASLKFDRVGFGQSMFTS